MRIKITTPRNQKIIPTNIQAAKKTIHRIKCSVSFLTHQFSLSYWWYFCQVYFGGLLSFRYLATSLSRDSYTNSLTSFPRYFGLFLGFGRPVSLHNSTRNSSGKVFSQGLSSSESIYASFTWSSVSHRASFILKQLLGQKA